MSKGLEALNTLARNVESLEIDTFYECKGAYQTLEKSLKALEIIKPLCEVVETPVKKYRYLKVNGVVVYTFKNEEEFDLLKEVIK